MKEIKDVSKVRVVIIFSGAIGVGKTTASNYIKNKYNFIHLSYVDLIWKPILYNRNLPTNLENLQNLGEELREKYGIRGLARKILPYISPNNSIIIDDVRYPDAYDELKQCLDKEVYLLYIKTDINFRFQRLKNRDHLKSLNELAKIEKRKSETSISKLEGMADFIIINNGNLEEFQEQIDQCIFVIMEDRIQIHDTLIREKVHPMGTP